MTTTKYTDTEYIDAVEFDDRDVEIRARKKVIVTVRKEQRCAFGDLLMRPHQIVPGTRAVRETAVVESKWGSCYCCLDCVGRWLDERDGGYYE